MGMGVRENSFRWWALVQDWLFRSKGCGMSRCVKAAKYPEFLRKSVVLCVYIYIYISFCFCLSLTAISETFYHSIPFIRIQLLSTTTTTTIQYNTYCVWTTFNIVCSLQMTSLYINIISRSLVVLFYLFFTCRSTADICFITKDTKR